MASTGGPALNAGGGVPPDAGTGTAGGPVPRAGIDRFDLSTEMLRLMIDSVVDYAIFGLDPQGHVATWNEGARRLKRYQAEEIIGRHFSTFYPEAERQAGRPQRLLQTAIREGHVEDEGWRVRKDGSTFWANVVITALYDGGGRLRGFTKVTRDLTERRAAEDALRALAEREHEAAVQLRAANRSRRNLVAMVAHDLRAPIAVVHGTADTLVGSWDRFDDEKRRRSVEAILSGSRRLRALVEDVLDMSSLEAGTLRYNLTTVDLAAAVRRAAADVDRDSRVVIVTPDEPVLVRGDEQRIWQVSGNLMSNALKFSPANEHVEVTVSVDGEMGVVSVCDRGVGLSDEQQAAVFQPFVQFREEASGAAPSGTGLGLYIARSLVADQGGRIEVRSARGAGSTFSFSLPLAQ